MGIWNRIRQMMAPVKVQGNPSQVGNKVVSYNVQSWNPETHPEGKSRSKLVQDINYDNGHLSVTYNDGFTAGYDNISPQEAKDFVASDSKGRFALKHLWNKPYTQE